MFRNKAGWKNKDKINDEVFLLDLLYITEMYIVKLYEEKSYKSRIQKYDSEVFFCLYFLPVTINPTF